MKCGFLVHGVGISGGIYVVFEHAIRMSNRGNDIYLLSPEKLEDKDFYWHPEAKKLKKLTYQEAEKETFDIVFATWWVTVYDLYKIKSNVYAYFNQSVESKFYSKNQKTLKLLADMTYLQNLNIITEATWIQKYLMSNYGINAKLVKNGIRKDIYSNKGDSYSEKSPDELRILIEGPLESSFKNVDKTIKICKKSKADEIWLLTSSNVKKVKGVDKVFSKIPIFETPKIYRSCDLLVKLSYVEGMFGPPLEMFHCGGTVIVYDVTGHDEYIKHNENAFVIKTDNENEVINSINLLKENRNELIRLKEGALKTAENWYDWEAASILFEKMAKEFIKENSEKKINNVDNIQKKLFNFNKAYQDILQIQINTSFLSKTWDFLLKKQYFFFPKNSKRRDIALKIYFFLKKGFKF